MDVLKTAHTADDLQPGVSVDLFTTSVTELDPELVGALDEPTAAAVARVRELSADSDRISRLISDLVSDGLAGEVDGRLSLPS